MMNHNNFFPTKTLSYFARQAPLFWASTKIQQSHLQNHMRKHSLKLRVEEISSNWRFFLNVTYHDNDLEEPKIQRRLSSTHTSCSDIFDVMTLFKANARRKMTLSQGYLYTAHTSHATDEVKAAPEYPPGTQGCP